MVFLLFVCNFKNDSKNIFQHLTRVENCQISLIFSWNLRSCEEERNNEEEMRRKRVCESRKAFESKFEIQCDCICMAILLAIWVGNCERVLVGSV